MFLRLFYMIGKRYFARFLFSMTYFTSLFFISVCSILHAYEPSAPCEISFSPDELGDIHPPSEPVKMSQTGIMQISLESPSSSYEEMGEQGRGLIRPCAVTPDSGFLCEEDNIIVVTQETNSSALKTHEDDDILLSQSTCSINGDSSDSQVLK